MYDFVHEMSQKSGNGWLYPRKLWDFQPHARWACGSRSWSLYLSDYLEIILKHVIGQKVVSRTNRRTVWSHVTWKNEDDLPTNSVLKVSGQVVFTWHHTVLSLVDQTVWCQLSAPELGWKNIHPGRSYEPLLPTLYTLNKATRHFCKFKCTM